MHQRVTLAILLFILSLQTWADQLIIEPDMGRQPILEQIQKANHTIDLVMYGFTDKPLLEALIKQHKIGKTVHVILERSPYKTESENTNTIAAFQANKLTWQGQIPPFHLIHQKTLILDDKNAVIMTFNFTGSTFKNQRNFGLIIDDPKKVRDIAAIFASDWHHIPIQNKNTDLILSPDDSREKLVALIADAKQSIDIYAQSVSDYKIIGALATAAKKGVSITVITSNTIKAKTADYLARAGIRISYSKKLYIHAKVFIIDNQLAIIGSTNLTQASLDKNRELSIVTRDRNIVNQLKKCFDRDKEQFSHSERQPINQDVKKFMPDKKTIRRFVKMLDKMTKNWDKS